MISEHDWKREQEWLDRVTGQLLRKIATLEPEVTDLRDQVQDFRRRFWEEVTVNTATSEDFEETFYSIRQQEALLSERERSHRQRLRQWNNMRRMLPAPYFGRIDFAEDGVGLAEPVYIGVSSLIDEEELNFLVYDWRTPIASMYYDYTPGAVSYVTPNGTVQGKMNLKRQYQIRNGELRNIFDTSLTIGDELLQQALGQGADAQMRSIVATIQKEQNAIIRDDRSRMLIVQGAAGSGKTSAALQRAAYLLYKNRDRLTADQIVLFSPNPMFNSYVSSVLPELGEENMQQTTFQEYLSYWLEPDVQLESPFDQLEYVLTAQQTAAYEARLEGIRHKASESWLQALQSYAAWLCTEGMRFRGIGLMGRELIAAERIKRQFYSYDRSIQLANRIALLREWLLQQLAALEHRERKAGWVQDELDYLDNEQYDQAYRTLLRKVQKEDAPFDFTQVYVDAYDGLSGQKQGEENVFDYAGQEEELLRRLIVKERFKPIRDDIRRFAFIDVIGLYGQLFGDAADYSRMTGGFAAPAYWSDIGQQTREKLDRSELFYEDATSFLYFKELVEGVRRNTNVRYVFVDEGQDYSSFQYAFLKRLFPRARMTVLGDFGQAIFAQATHLHGEDSPLVRLYGPEETRLIRLVRSYRSTWEIVTFTKQLLNEGGEIVPFDRHGEKPRLLQLADSEERTVRILEDLEMLQAKGFDSIAVITKTSAESREACASLAAKGGEALRLVSNETRTFEKGIAVIPAYLAKGVEFDAVLIYDASSRAYSRESERKLFYTACTRAMHHLRLYTTGDLTPFMQGVGAESLETES